MRRLFLLLAIAALIVALFCVAGGVALAKEEIGFDYITPDYIEWGTLQQVAACGDSVAVLQTYEDGAVWLTYVHSDHSVDLTAAYLALKGTALAIDPAAVQMAIYGDIVLLHLGDDLLYAYTPVDGLVATAVRTAFDVPLMGAQAISAFGIDSDGTLCVGYRTMMGYGPIHGLADLTDPDFQFADGTTLPVDHVNYRMVVQGGKCYIYYSDSYLSFSYRTQQLDKPLRTVEAMDAFSYTASPLFLRHDTLYMAELVGEEWQERAVVAAQAMVGGSATDWSLSRATVCVGALGTNGWRVYIADNGQHALKCYDADFTLVRMYGSHGTSADRLHDPTCVDADAMTAIVDGGNGRVVVHRGTEITLLEGTAQLVATGGEKVFVANSLLVHIYNFARPTGDLPYTQSTLYFDSAVTSLCSDGTNGYALSDNVLYRLGAEPIEVRQVPNALSIAAGKHEGMVYVQTTEGILAFKDGYSVGEAIDTTHLQIAAMDIDYCGNVYALLADHTTVQRFMRQPDGYTADAVHLAGPVTHLAIRADGAVLGLYHHALVQVALPVQSTVNAHYDHPTQYDFVVGKIENQVWGYGSPNNYGSIQMVKPCYALHLATVTYLDATFAYVELDDTVSTRVYIPTAAIAYLPDKIYEGYNVRYNGTDATTRVYRHPSYNAEAVAEIPSSQATFRVKRMMGLDGDACVWPWYEVEYQGGVAYVNRYYYIEDKITYPTVQRYYARCVASKLGAVVNVYADPDWDAEVVATLVDGTRVEMTAPLDKDSEFTKIRLGDREVFVATVGLTDTNLTNGQTFAILMSVVVVLAAIVTVVLYALVRRKRR